jgi:hypothetical protein
MKKNHYITPKAEIVVLKSVQLLTTSMRIIDGTLEEGEIL